MRGVVITHWAYKDHRDREWNWPVHYLSGERGFEVAVIEGWYALLFRARFLADVCGRSLAIEETELFSLMEVQRRNV
jgi:hypothetical protein